MIFRLIGQAWLVIGVAALAWNGLMALADAVAYLTRPRL